MTSVAPRLIRDQRPDGAIRLICSVPLSGADVDIAARLRHWAKAAPNRVLLSAPGKTDRRVVTYVQALDQARSLHAALAAAGVRPGARIASLLSAGIEALTLRLACLLGNFIHVSLPPHSFRGVESCPPKAGEAARLWQVLRPDLLVLPAGHALIGQGCAVCLSGLAPGPAVADQDGTPDDWTAIFFTAGSTGAPKGVAITRHMIASCQAACAAIWPFLAQRPPVLIDWMPWNHVFGGLDNLFKTIWNGGTLHLVPPPSDSRDVGMVALMAKVRPTLLIGVPLGLRILLDAWDEDASHVAEGCSDLGEIFFAGAAMEPALWARLQEFRHAMETLHGRQIRLLSGYGATEAASTMCLVPGNISAPGYLGWPLPGHEIALVQTDGGNELRFRGPNLAPCYLGEDGPFPLPLDDLGYYCTGDAAVIEDGPDGQPVLRFDGRLSEDFKLSSGIKVRAGTLRGRLLRHLGPRVQDIILGGEGRDALVALIFPATNADGFEDDLSQAFAMWNRENAASSSAIGRFAIADLRPSAEAGEVSAKGQLVQSRILRNHAGLFAALSDGLTGRAPAALQDD